MATFILMAPIYRPFDHVWEDEPFTCPWCKRPLKKGDSVATQFSASGCFVYSVCERCDRERRYGE